MSSGARHSLSMILESTRGTTPATPTMSPIRHTSCSLKPMSDFFQSQELRSDRQITDIIQGGYHVAGDIGFELSYGGSFDTIWEALLQGTWSTNVLKAGTTRRYFTIEQLFADQSSGDNPYHRFRGCEIAAMSLSVKANSKVEGSISVVGKDLALDSAIISGETYASASTTTPFNSFSGTITEGGSTIAIVTELSLNLDNGITPIFFVGSQASGDPDVGRSNLTGSLSVQFRNATLLQKFLAGTESAIVLTLTDPAGNDLAINLPRIKYTDCTNDVTNEQSIIQTLPLQALLDSATALSNIVLTRTPAT